jgi:osmotically-inducible protein OsmY
MKITQRLATVLFVAVTATLSLTALGGCAATRAQESTGQYLDDTVITTRVKAAIFEDANLKSAEINVETFKGVVQLSGFVNSQTDIDRAVTLTRSVSGVKSVKNDMRLK